MFKAPYSARNGPGTQTPLVMLCALVCGSDYKTTLGAFGVFMVWMEGPEFHPGVRCRQFEIRVSPIFSRSVERFLPIPMLSLLCPDETGTNPSFEELR